MRIRQICVVSTFQKYTCLQFRPDPVRKPSADLCEIYHCCVYSEKLLMMDRGTVRDMLNIIPKINSRN